jgi:hypothetical protein
MKYAFALLFSLLTAASASAAEPCPLLTARPPGELSSRMDTEVYQQRLRLQAMQATYQALLAAGAPDSLACAAALNPDLLRQIAPTYFGRPPR